MNAVGIEVSKGKSMLAVLSPLGVTVGNPLGSKPQRYRS